MQQQVTNTRRNMVTANFNKEVLKRVREEFIERLVQRTVQETIDSQEFKEKLDHKVNVFREQLRKDVLRVIK